MEESSMQEAEMLGVRSLSSSLGNSQEAAFFSPKPSRAVMRAEEEGSEVPPGQATPHNSHTCATPPLPWLAGVTPASASTSSSLASYSFTTTASNKRSPSQGSPSKTPSSPGSIGAEYEMIIKQKAQSEQRLRALMESKEHARRTYPHIRRVWNDFYMKIMVAGESGHGKTTFLNNTFSSFVDGREIKPHDGSRTSVEDFRADPDKLCSSFTVENAENMERMHYAVQDTPGYGDDTNIATSIQLIVDFILKKNEEYLKVEENAARTKSVAAHDDPRVDVCLYFIAAHRLKAIDIKFMQAISKYVSVIPIIAKADSMTAEETKTFRKFIMDECHKHQIRLFDFGEDIKAAVGIPKDLVVPPFAVVASNHFDEVRGAGSYWPVRDYHWGTCEAFSTQHSDCTYLKRLLLEEGFHDLRAATEERYLEFRREYYEKERVKYQQAQAKGTRRLAISGLVACLLMVFLGWVAVSGRKKNLRDPLSMVLGAVRRAEVTKLSQKLQRKDHELRMAEHKIELLHRSVRELEQHMQRLAAETSNPARMASQEGGVNKKKEREIQVASGGGNESNKTQAESSKRDDTTSHHLRPSSSGGSKGEAAVLLEYWSDSYPYNLMDGNPAATRWFFS